MVAVQKSHATCSMEQPVKNSCHSNEEQMPCCNDEAQFSINNQISAPVFKYVYIPVIQFLPQFLQSTIEIEQDNNTLLTQYVYPPPIYKSRLPIVFQQFLC